MTDLIEVAKAHDRAAQSDRKYYSRHRKIAFTVRKYERSIK